MEQWVWVGQWEEGEGRGCSQQSGTVCTKVEEHKRHGDFETRKVIKDSRSVLAPGSGKANKAGAEGRMEGH